MKFEVWAPGHRRAELLLDEGVRRLSMESAMRGSFCLEVPEAGPGTRYLFSLDGGPGRPDPRSGWQPEGIDGPSAVVDHGSFVWHDSDWKGRDLASAVLYELHIGTFSDEGTFEGAVAHLDHLVALGANAVEVMPVAEGSGDRGWGYDGADLWAPHHAYGGPEGLKRFVDACHSRGLCVVIDVVYNHLGPAGNYLAEFGPYFTNAYATPWGAAVNFDDAGSYGVRDFVVSNALMWLSDYHADGLRLDAVHAVHDEGALHLVEELSAAVDSLSSELGRELWVIAESDRNDPRVARSRSSHGWGTTACWDDDFHHALHALMTGERSGYYLDFGEVGQVAKAFRHGYVYDGIFSEFRQRRHGRPAEELPGCAFVVCLQNHDQVGNRALGERLHFLVGPELAKVGAALLLLSPYVPMLFQGEEWAASAPFLYFTDHRDPELGRAVSEGRRREHRVGAGVEVPDPQEVGTFLRSKLDWGELEREPHRSMLEWHRALISLRSSEPDLGCGDRAALSTAFDEGRRWLVVRRGRFSIAANFADEAQPVPLGGAGEVVLASGAGSGAGSGRGSGWGSAPAGGRVSGGVGWLPGRSVVLVAH
jgi:maltooligosyltrehalose trehalohydrolase